MADAYGKNRLLARTIPGVKKTHPMGCWAACMEWWGKATGRANMSQENIRATCTKMTENNGGMLPDHLKAILEVGPWWADVKIYQAGTRMVCSGEDVASCHPECDPVNIPLMSKLRSGPVILGYYHLAPQGGSMHAIVVIAPPATPNGEFAIMEPDTGKITTRSISKLRVYCTGKAVVAAFPAEEVE